jgi:hypothetical protein
MDWTWAWEKKYGIWIGMGWVGLEGISYIAWQFREISKRELLKNLCDNI